MSKFKDILNYEIKEILNYEITPRRKKKEKRKKKPSYTHGRFDIDTIKILMLLAGPFGLIYYFTAYRKVKLVRMMNIFGSIRMIIQNNAPLVKGLRTIALDAPDSRIGIVLHSLSDEIEQGASLTDALELYPNVIHPRYTDLIRIGERTGRLKPCLGHVVSSIQQRLNTTRVVTANLSYVLMVAIIQIFIISFLVIKVIPVFAEILSEFGLPLTPPAKFIVDLLEEISHNTGNITSLLLILIYGTIIFLFLHKHSASVRSISARFLFSIPIFGRILRLRQLHTISEALEELVRAGIPVHEALDTISTMNLASPYRYAIKSLSEKLASGQSLKEALAESPRLLGETFCTVLELGEYTGNLDESCVRLKGLYRRELNLRVSVMSEAMIPLYVMVGGALNLWILLATYGSIFGLNDAVSRNL